MVNKTQKDIIKEEIDAIISDIKDVYEASGKRTSGEFLNGLESIISENTGIIKGYTYLAGRRAGKMPPIENIKRWIIQKGIQPIRDTISISSLAYVIAKKIGENGTNKKYHLKIYEEVITPQRIDDIIKKVSQFNVNKFVDDITVSLELLAENV